MSKAKQGGGSERRYNLKGQTFERLLVLCWHKRKEGKRGKWECHCSCGKIVYIDTSNLLRGMTTSCGCLKKEQLRERLTTTPLTGGGRPLTYNILWQRFGQLTVVGKDPNGGQWICQCDCGLIVKRQSGDLRTRDRHSCGCDNPRYGLSTEELIELKKLLVREYYHKPHSKKKANNQQRRRIKRAISVKSGKIDLSNEQWEELKKPMIIGVLIVKRKLEI